MRVIPERHDAVIAHPVLGAPDGNVAVVQLNLHGPFCSLETTEQKRGGHSERHGDDGCLEVAFILVLVQRQSCSRHVAVNQARIRRKPPNPALCAASRATRANTPGIAGQGRSLSGSIPVYR